MKLESKKLGKYWWIVGDDDGPFGPYHTKKECDEDRRGIVRTMENKDLPGYVVTKKDKK